MSIAPLNWPAERPAAVSAHCLLAASALFATCASVHAQVGERLTDNQRVVTASWGHALDITSDAVELRGESPVVDSSVMPASAISARPTHFGFEYDRGLLFSLQHGADSFELKTNLRTQVRGSRFSRFDKSWTDNAGVTREIEDRQSFDIERARLIFSGHAFTPRLKYFLQMDGDTDRGHLTAFFDYWWAWEFSDTLELQFGKRKVAAGRNWLLGAFDTRLADRAFSVDFFRPGRTTGLWLVGDPTEAFHYELMIGQGWRTENLTPADTSAEFATAATTWWDVIGDYGPDRPTDFEYHDDPAVRLGASWVSSQEGRPGLNLPEADFLRLSDGTRLTQPGALIAGATVERFDVTFLGIDAAFKCRGWSANFEYFWRWVTDIKADMPLPDNDLFQHGYFVEGGCFLVPQEWEINAQLAEVHGEFGSSFSFASGVSWYPRNTQYLKLTLDVTAINGSPVNSTGSDILVGDDGVLIRAQVQALF